MTRVDRNQSSQIPQRDRIRAVMGNGRSNVMRFAGTMMPFYWGASTLRWRPKDLEDHPAVKTWTITLYGAVEVKEAGVLLSTVTPKPAIIAATVFLEPVALQNLRPTLLETKDMYDLMKAMVDSRSVWGVLHAVVLMPNKAYLEGLLIINLSFGGRYGKLGNFYIQRGDSVCVPASEEVNWTVD
jgi:hypothetical protein